MTLAYLRIGQVQRDNDKAIRERINADLVAKYRFSASAINQLNLLNYIVFFCFSFSCWNISLSKYLDIKITVKITERNLFKALNLQIINNITSGNSEVRIKRAP